MTQQFTIQGMTCGNCQKTVTEKIKNLPSVTSVFVDLSSGHTSIDAATSLSKKQLEAALGTKYTVLPADAPVSSSKWKQLYPLYLILTYVVLGALYLTGSDFSIPTFMLNYMGLFFIVFAFFKFLDYKGFPSSFANYDPLARRVSLYAKVYPFIETLLGIAFLMAFQVKLALLFTLLILSITTAGVIKSLVHRRQIECACLGTVLKLPMTEATLIENSIMLVMTLAMGVGEYIL